MKPNYSRLKGMGQESLLRELIKLAALGERIKESELRECVREIALSAQSHVNLQEQK